MVQLPAVVLAVHLLLKVPQEGFIGGLLISLLLHLNDSVVDDEDGIPMLLLLRQKNNLDPIKNEVKWTRFIRL